MDTKPIRELINWAAAAHNIIEEGHGFTARNLRKALTAAERALAAEPGAVYGSETPATHYLPDQNEALRLADELSAVALAVAQSKGRAAFITVGEMARAYRKARGLEVE